MNRRSGFGAILGLLLAGPTCVDAHQTKQEGPPHLNIVVCDKAGIGSETRVTASNELHRILNAAGVNAAWIDTNADAQSPTAFVPTSFEGCGPPPLDEYLLMVISPNAPKGWTPDVMGLAYARGSGYRRGYILYDRVIAFVDRYSLPAARTSSIGIILGHAIAHELGHLLIPGDAHSRDGIMRGDWSYREWREALAGYLLFHSAHAELIRRQMLR